MSCVDWIITMKLKIVKEPFSHNEHNIWNFSDSYRTQFQGHIICQRTFVHLDSLTECKSLSV